MNIKQYLPSKKVRIGIIILFALGLIYLMYFLFTTFYSPETEQEFVDVAFVPSNEITNRDYYTDTDGDGAYDWEEALWPELDPNNPDSDGDGVSDGRYIKAKRAIQNQEQGLINENSENLTETQKFGRGALTALLTIQRSGEEITPETEAQISQNIELYISELTLGEKIYTRDEFNLVENSKENSYAYRDAMKKLFTAYPIATNDIELIIKATENIDQMQGRLRAVATKYNNYLGELVAIEVPFVIAGRHTELVNNVSQIAGAANNLSQDEADEIIRLSTIVQLEKIMNETADAVIKINTYFEIINDETLFN